MSKAYHCPACKNEVDRAATICGNPACRRELAFCSHCHDVSTYTPVGTPVVAPASEAGPDTAANPDVDPAPVAQGAVAATVASLARGRRARFVCDRCERQGVKCLTWLAGGYCNGLARVGERMDAPLCANCSGRALEIGRSVLAGAALTAIGGLIRRRK